MKNKKILKQMKELETEEIPIDDINDMKEYLNGMRIIEAEAKRNFLKTTHKTGKDFIEEYRRVFSEGNLN